MNNLVAIVWRPEGNGMFQRVRLVETSDPSMIVGQYPVVTHSGIKEGVTSITWKNVGMIESYERAHASDFSEKALQEIQSAWGNFRPTSEEAGKTRP